MDVKRFVIIAGEVRVLRFRRVLDWILITWSEACGISFVSILTSSEGEPCEGSRVLKFATETDLTMRILPQGNWLATMLSSTVLTS
jgi:hypothetical protein